MAKPVVPGDGYFSIGEYSFPKSKVFQQVRDSDFVVQSVASDSSLTFKFNDLVDSEGDPYASKEDAIADLQAIMFLPEEEFVVDGSEPQALILGFDNISSANTLVGDASDVNDWNTFFDLPTFGTPFTSVELDGNNVKLFGGSGIIVKPNLFDEKGESLLLINDQIGCIEEVGENAFGFFITSGCGLLETVILNSVTSISNYAFLQCASLLNLEMSSLELIGESALAYLLSIETILLPNVTSVGPAAFIGNDALLSIIAPQLQDVSDSTFSGCVSLISIEIPSCISLGSTIGDNSVFFEISGQTISLTIPSALMTVNGGNPDGDIQYLVANNTVTITTV